jgi:hypothetical protein
MCLNNLKKRTLASKALLKTIENALVDSGACQWPR